MSETSGVYSAASELGINVEALDESPDFETETESMEAEGEVKEEVVETEALDDGESDEPSLEGEEKKEIPVEESKEAPIEEPRLTAKEFQEIQAARQELEAREAAFTERMQAMEKDFQSKYHEKVQAHDELDSFLAELAQSDADLFDLVKEKFQAHQKQYNNPVNQKLESEVKELKAQLNQFLTKASDEVTMTKLNSELNQVKTTLGKEAEAAGLKVDWRKIEDAWADNPKIDLKKAFYAEYGESLLNAKVSKAKVEAVTKKVEGRPSVATAGTTKAAATPSAKNVPSNVYDAVRFYARELTGKA
jgi:succinate dehydrogenase flavin-adding protein (antitoxin of CptAB toxin-antitoxin module)